MSDKDFERQLVVLRDYLMAFCMIRCSKRHADAEDLCQETLMRAWQHRESFDGSNLKAWLFTIMTNYKFSQQRNQLVADRYIAGMSLAGCYQPAEALHALQYKQICNVMERVLSEEQLEAIWCHALGQTIDEIAVKTSVAAGTVKSRVGRGRARLKAFA